MIVASLVWVLSSMTAYGSGGSKTVTVGYDVSWPDCARTLPANAGFAVVGVNGGSSNNSNPCFRTELARAIALTGVAGRPKVALYVNTGNPGKLRLSDWPKNNLDPITHIPVADPQGKCSGRDTAACAWQYGWNRAEADVRKRGVAHPRRYTWWLDVETENYWESNRARNRIDLEGMVDYFHSVGISAGVYCTGYQWRIIAGSVGSRSPLYKLIEWIPGAGNIRDAHSNCGLAPFTRGGQVDMTQWVGPTDPVDQDYFCPPTTPYVRNPVRH